MLVFILFYLISASIVLGVEVLEAMRVAAAWLGANQKRWDVCQHPPMHTHVSIWIYLVLIMCDGPLTILQTTLCLEYAL